MNCEELLETPARNIVTTLSSEEAMTLLAHDPAKLRASHDERAVVVLIDEHVHHSGFGLTMFYLTTFLLLTS